MGLGLGIHATPGIGHNQDNVLFTANFTGRQGFDRNRIDHRGFNL